MKMHTRTCAYKEALCHAMRMLNNNETDCMECAATLPLLLTRLPAQALQVSDAFRHASAAVHMAERRFDLTAKLRKAFRIDMTRGDETHPHPNPNRHAEWSQWVRKCHRFTLLFAWAKTHNERNDVHGLRRYFPVARRQHNSPLAEGKVLAGCCS